MIVGTNRNLGTAVPLDVSIVDGSGNQVTAFGGSGGTSHGDDAAFSIGSASSITPIGALCDETSPDPVDEGDAGLVRMTADRKLLMRLVGASDANRADVNASGHLKIEIATDSVGIGGGTQYTEDDAAAANPVGTVPMLIRTDTPATQVSTDGDNIAQRATNYGAAYVQIVTSAGAYVDSFGGGVQYTEGDTDATITGTALMFEGAANTLVAAPGTAADGLLVNLGTNNDVTITGTVAVTQSGTWDEVGINDSGNSITVDNPTLSVVGGGTEATALRVTIANDSTGLVSIDDNGGSLTVDNGGTFAVQATIASGASSFVHLEDDASANLDAGAGMLAVRKATPANTSGTDGDYEFLQMSAGRLWTSATIDAALPAGTNNIGDIDVLTVPAPLSTTGNGTAATALRVTVASDSTGQIALAAGTNNIGDVDILSHPMSATATVTSVNDAATNQTLLSSNASRKGFCLFNDTTVIAYVKFGTTATSTDYTVRMNPLDYYELSGPHAYTGRIDCIWASDASGAMKVTELT